MVAIIDVLEPDSKDIRHYTHICHAILIVIYRPNYNSTCNICSETSSCLECSRDQENGLQYEIGALLVKYLLKRSCQ